MTISTKEVDEVIEATVLMSKSKMWEIIIFFVQIIFLTPFTFYVNCDKI